MQPGSHNLNFELKHYQAPQIVRAESPVDPLFARTYGEDQRELHGILALSQRSSRYRRDRVIFFEGDPTDYLLYLSRGSVRTCRSFKDGNRSVVAFHVVGEFFGFDREMTHSLRAEAATDTIVLPLKRSAVLAKAVHDRRISDFLLAGMAKELRRLREHAALISRNAQCRLATFLIDLSARTGKTENLDLPMSHQDIADYVGLSIETVSRVITQFERSGFVSRTSARSLMLRDRNALMRIMA